MNRAPNSDGHALKVTASAPPATAEGGRPQHPKSGRPKKKKADLRTAQFRIRVTPREKDRIEHEAREAGLSSSDYLRRRALGEPVVAQADAGAERQLRRVGVNLNQLVRAAHAGGLAAVAAEAGAVLDEVRAQVAKVWRSPEGS